MAKNPSADPISEDFPKGPEVGERVPDINLPDQSGETILYQPDGSCRALILFHRSADW